MKIHEILDRDPRDGGLANNGQARITGLANELAQKELRAELETFVCDGQYGDSIQRILASFLADLDRPRQKAAWVSGFYGSGKSHLLKMLGHLWVNTEFGDGTTARSLVQGLPQDVEAQLRELDTQAKRSGKAQIAAAGTLPAGSGDHVRRTILSIIFRACDWPDQYTQAQFCFWLRDEGLLDAVKAEVEAAGRNWLKELNNLYVSPFIARAVLKANPGFAENEAGVHRILIQQYPQSGSDITTPQFIEATRKALTADGELPLTILVLDEVQQYISDSSDRAVYIAETTEAIYSQLDSRIMLVASGQSALTGTPNLQRLRDRFTITSQLSDADVEAVTRKVLLRKKASANTDIEKMLENHAGEIDRHLKGTKIGPVTEDRRYRVADYPLLPTRRRFWEECFRAVDAAGTHSQLRSQLKIIHESLNALSEKNLGTLIPSSDLYRTISNDLVSTGVLLNEISTRITKLDDGTDDGHLRQALCGLIFLIGKLSGEEGIDLGVKADASTLADLEFNDLSSDSGPFRKRVTTLLEGLVDDGIVMKVGEEYRIQTTEGAEWDQSFRKVQQAFRQNEGEIARLRDNLFGQDVRRTVDKIKLIHGNAKVKRTLALHIGDNAPTPGSQHVSVWLRDGWSTTLKETESQARKLGNDDPTLHIHLPKKSADDLKARIVDVESAQQVLDRNGIPTTREGEEARASMESRQRSAEQSRDAIVREIIRAARVFQGGGTEIFAESLDDKVREGAESSLARLFPRFHEGDHKAWEAALKRAKQGSDEPLKIVGWDRPTEEHPVAKEILNEIKGDIKGTEVQKAFKGGQFGWPQDAIDAVLIALHHSEHLRATKNANPIAPGHLDQAGVKAATFRPQKVRLTPKQKLAIRGLYQNLANVNAASTEVELRAAEFLAALVSIGESAGGSKPLPIPPDMKLITDLKGMTGNEQLLAILDSKDELEDAVQSWKALAKLAEERMPQWTMACTFRNLADDLPVVEEVGPELDAIETGRALLEETDLVTPLLGKLGGALRKELTGAHTGLSEAIKNAQKNLDADSTWAKLDEDTQGQVLKSVGLEPPAKLSISTDAELKQTLEQNSLKSLRAATDAVSQRVTLALAEAAELLNPELPAISVSIRRCTLENENAVKAWIKEHEQKLLESVTKGPVIIS